MTITVERTSPICGGPAAAEPEVTSMMTSSESRRVVDPLTQLESGGRAYPYGHEAQKRSWKKEQCLAGTEPCS